MDFVFVSLIQKIDIIIKQVKMYNLYEYDNLSDESAKNGNLKLLAFSYIGHNTDIVDKIKYLLPNFEYNGYDNTTQIFIGIPSIIEKMIYKLV